MSNRQQRDGVLMEGVREYAEDDAVHLVSLCGDDLPPYEMAGAVLSAVVGERLVIEALNEGGHNCTRVDLLDVLRWVKKHRPDLLA